MMGLNQKLMVSGDIKGTLANIVNPDQTSQDMASDQDLHCMR